MNLCQPSVVRALMEEAGIAFRREYGQNFLIDRSVPERIAESCWEREDALVLEIGPGVGCLTQELARRFARVVAVEIDTGLLPILAKTLGGFDNVTVVPGDIMKTDIAALVEKYGEGRDVVVCANLPYYITTPILMRLLESGVPFRSLTLMVQSEVAQRLAAPAGSSNYGAITAVVGYYGAVRRLFTVPPGCFMPAPKVSSAVVRIDLYAEKPAVPRDERLFFATVHAAFEQRRKTLCNALGTVGLGLSKEALAAAVTACGLSPTVRGERLSAADFVRLSDALALAAGRI